MELVIHQIQSWFKWILCPRTPRVPQKYVGNQIQRSEKESIEENKVMIFMGDVDPRRIFKFIFFSPPQTSTPRIPPVPGRSLLRLVGGNVGGSMHGREWKSLLPLYNPSSLTCQLPPILTMEPSPPPFLNCSCLVSTTSYKHSEPQLCNKMVKNGNLGSCERFFFSVQWMGSSSLSTLLFTFFLWAASKFIFW